MDIGFPLPVAKLPKLQVDRATLRAWRLDAHSEVMELLRDRESWYYKGQEPKYAYKLIYNKRGLEGYICTTEAARRKEFYAHGVLKMYLEDVVFGLYTESTLDQRSVSAFMDDEAFLDAAVLDVDERQTLEDSFSFSGVKWAARLSPTGVDVHADSVYFECSFTTRDADGRTVLVQYVKSPELAPHNVLDSPETTRLARGQHQQITVFRADDEGTYVQSAGALVANDAIPSWVGMKTVLQAFSSLSNLVGLADARAVALLSVAKAQSASKVCYLCKKKFSLLRPRQNCRSCGHSICKHCTIKLKFFNVDGLQAAGRAPLLAEDKFCLPCVRHARDARPESDGAIATFVDSIVSEESVSDVALGIPVADAHSLSDDEHMGCGSGSLDDEQFMGSSGPTVSTSMRIARHIKSYDSGVAQTFYYQQQQQQRHKAGSSGNTVLYEPSLSASNPAHAFAARGSSAPPSYAQYEESSNASRSSTGSDFGSQRTDLSASGHQLRRARSARNGFPEPDPAAFHKLTESIAAQEALLQNIEFERQKLQQRRGGRVQHVPHYIHDSDRRSDRSDDRFEVISEAY